MGQQKAPGKSYRQGISLIELAEMFPDESSARDGGSTVSVRFEVLMPVPRQAQAQVVDAIHGVSLVGFEEACLLTEADMVGSIVGGVPGIQVGHTGEPLGFSFVPYAPQNDQNEVVVFRHGTLLEEDCSEHRYHKTAQNAPERLFGSKEGGLIDG